MNARERFCLPKFHVFNQLAFACWNTWITAMPFGETIVACATPLGESAIAMIRLSGPCAARIAREAFRLKKAPRPRYATLAAYYTLEGEKLDTVLFTFFAGARSYTGEAMLEIATHGNPLIIQCLLQDCLARGARLAEPGEFTKTAFLSGKMDLSQAEAVADLIHAKSQKSLAVAHKQLEGGLGVALNPLSDRLLAVLAEVEAYIDFPDEDIPAENVQNTYSQLQSILAALEGLQQSYRQRCLLKNGIRVALIGPPNAGKSSLLNALLGSERALVSPEAGTTRDFITESLRIGSICIQLTDTAGVQEPHSALEAASMQQSLSQLQQADFLLLVLDCSLPPPALLEVICQKLLPNTTLVINNKADLAEHPEHADFLPGYAKQRISTRDPEAIERLRAHLACLLEQRLVLPSDVAIVINERHFEAISKAIEAGQEAVSFLKANSQTELAAYALRQMLDCVGEVVGKVDNEAMLDKLFSAFCIGK